MKPKFFIFIILLISFSCKKEKDDTPPENNIILEPVISPSAKVLNSNSRKDILSIDTTDYSFVFNKNSEFASKLHINDVIIDEVNERMPFGYIRKIKSINTSGNNLIVTTEQAKLTDVIQQGSIRLDSVNLKSSKIINMKLTQGVKLSNKLKNTDLLGFDLDFEYPICNNENAKIKGSIFFELKFNFDLDITLLDGIKYFKSTIYFDEITSLGLEVSSGTTITDNIKLAEITFSPWVVWVGIVPVVFVPKVEFILSSDLTISASLKTFATQSFNRELGLEYKKDRDEQWKLINNTEPAPYSSLHPPALENNAKFIIKAGPQANLLLYGVAGPYINILLSSSINATTSPNGFIMDYNLDLESNAGVKVDVLVYELEKNFQLFSLNLKNQKLNDEPLTPDFTIEKPITNEMVLIGEILKIKTYITGIKPDSVSFYVNDVNIGNDNTYPFEFSWEVNGEIGNHTIKAIAYYGENSKTAETHVKFVKGGWEKIDLSYLFNTKYILEKVYFYNNQKGWIFGRTSNTIPREFFILLTSDGGKGWKKIYSSTDAAYPANSILFISETDGFFLYSDWLYQTKNGGYNWNLINTNSDFICINNSGDIFRANLYEIEILRSGGSGEWETFSTANENLDYLEDIYGIAFPIDNTGFVIGSKWNNLIDNNEDLIYKISENGSKWTKQDLNLDIPDVTHGFTKILFIDNQNGYIIGWMSNYNYSGFILKTNDGGQTWTKTFTSKTPKDIFFIDRLNGYITYTNYPEVKISYTMDGGQNWENYNIAFEQTTGVPQSIFFTDKAHGWYVCSNTYLRYGLIIQ